MKIPKRIQNKILKAHELTYKLQKIREEIIRWDFDNDVENLMVDDERVNSTSENLSDAIQGFIDYGELFDLTRDFKRRENI